MEKSGKTDMVNLFLLGLQTSKSITIDLYKCETCKRIFGVANIKGIKYKIDIEFILIYLIIFV